MLSSFVSSVSLNLVSYHLIFLFNISKDFICSKYVYKVIRAINKYTIRTESGSLTWIYRPWRINSITPIPNTMDVSFRRIVNSFDHPGIESEAFVA